VIWWELPRCIPLPGIMVGKVRTATRAALIDEPAALWALEGSDGPCELKYGILAHIPP